MSAAWEAHVPYFIDLHQLLPADLEPILAEETELWRQMLDWDFTSSANLVKKFVGMQGLNGYAMLVNRRVVGYAYFVAEDRKGLIGDLFVSEPYATPENETRLLAEVMHNVVRFSDIRRVESQLLMMRYPRRIPPPFADNLKIYERNFMVTTMGNEGPLLSGRGADKVHLVRWHERYQEDVARLISAAYRGHVDSNINDQYRSVSGARKFLSNIIQYPGCGSFFQPASWIAWDQDTGHICGACLASLVSNTTGHITQICVMPSMKGSGVGYELIRNTLRSFADYGCLKTTLTVTAINRDAINLYERVGFHTLRQFSAMVWDGF